uniref:Dynein light chain n=1 Tax=Romanomermis culicivorax TaxID=13658 RepID=A0A915I472_ROMCU
MATRAASSATKSAAGAQTPRQRDENWDRLEQALNQTSKRQGVKIVDLDMPDDQVKEMVDAINAAMDATNVECEVADKVKTIFDNKYPGPWHCIAGKKFSSKVSYEGNHFCYVHMGTHIALLLFKAKSAE